MDAESFSSRRFPAAVAGCAVVVALAELLVMPRTFWEMDEILFARGILDFDPLNHHPHPPGYPLLIGLGKALNFVFGNPFVSLVVLSFVSAIVIFVAAAAAFRNITGSESFAITAAFLLMFSPALLVDATLPLSDPAALAFLALAFWLASSFPERATSARAIAFGVACSASIGCRPQFAVALLPIFFFVLWEIGAWRKRVVALAAFTIMSLAWLLPLIVAVGGVAKWIAWETHQASYVAAHDAAISRGARSTGEVILRFVAHPWGTKLMSLPVLVVAAVGLGIAVRLRVRKTVPMVLLAVVHVAFAIATMDPADGVRYVLPSLFAIALLVAFAFPFIAAVFRSRYAPAMLVAAFAISSWLYVRPLTRVRAAGASPPVMAAAWGEENLPRDAVILWESSLRPHAEFLFRGFEVLPVDAGLRKYFASDRPLVLFADGGSLRRGVRQFAWPDSDAYGKLTRNHYRVVSLVPVPPQDRFLPGGGVYPFERTTDGREWRWLSRRAEVIVPAGGRHLTIGLTLPPDAPDSENAVTIRAGAVSTAAIVKRGGTTRVTIALPSNEQLAIGFESARDYVPADAIGNRDPRRLAVQLTTLERVP